MLTMKTRFSRLVTLLLVGALLIVGISSVTAQETAVGPITQRIIDRGTLICGANNTVRGFGFQDETGAWAGFDVDICRAVAAAILGDANAVEFRYLEASARQAAIQSGEIDMM